MISPEQKKKVQELADRGGAPCASCGAVGPKVVMDDAVAAQVWQPKVDGCTEGVDVKHTFPFAVACCASCHAATLYPWGPLFGFAPPAGAN